MAHPYVMSTLEVAWGYLFGRVGSPPPATGTTATPRAALERVVRSALLRPPCGVAFSGGRDSSLVLAVATHVARRDGLQEPVPITKRFPDVPEAEESSWQENVIRHLGLVDWQRVELRDEVDLVGPLATANLVEFGVVWPPTIHGDVPMLQHLGRGSLIDGEGGDELLGVAAHRIAAVDRLLRAPRRISRRRVRAALGAIAPARVRAAHVRRRRTADLPITWLRPAALERVLDALADEEARRPLPFARSVRAMSSRRAHVVLASNRAILAGRRDVAVSSPLAHPDVVDALARAGGFLGPGDRTAVLRTMAADLLPDDVLSRTSKATFNGVLMTEHTHEFAHRWTGGGLDPELVDAEELARLWRGDGRNALTSALLQAAWLAEHQRSRTRQRTVP